MGVVIVIVGESKVSSLDYSEMHIYYSIHVRVYYGKVTFIFRLSDTISIGFTVMKGN